MGHRHYYLAVGNPAMKLPTLTNLLNELDAQEPTLSVVVVANSRDTLDELVSSISSLGYETSFLHSDMHSGWRRSVLEGFNETSGAGGSRSKMAVLVSSDVCMPVPASGELRTRVRLLVSYDIPSRKEEQQLRATCVAEGGILINVLAANEVSMLKSLEGLAGAAVEEIPLILSELFE
ncbi:helicase C-terminal domain-containing protein [Chloropicon primus]|uniref:Helicase C-terminal domain-containing protein n=1 Tax=Chloropicon primus TaxID=1764295 RepID=A0A5B8MI13_9CHLO|nr:hypothetical protein A3770_02p18130 [Chloropicon primus]UPQ98504.1 helicase C-terminal domain-containing protein [Chloropicon primus]|mmetsp:Transcript_6834/g.19967  ORF Transcript_6834/g.19967 Transcript_6834/m.19967 type:complete len:178 (+) Transcript_6834:83-616(+)|eukprot:QDZ19295.1 hypothetical protein A3770_02p18130 [Chloropicon primus]